MKKKISCYYRIRKCIFWGIITVLIDLIGIAYFKDTLYDKWLHSQGEENISFTGIKSYLDDEKACFLCSDNSQYHKRSSLGVISINDLNIIEVYLINPDMTSASIGGLSTTFGNTGEISYFSKSIPSKGMASLKITLSEGYKLDTSAIQIYLCQECLDKVAESLSYRKWKNEKKEAIPLCLVDFKTLEFYSLQDWYRGYMVRNYWVELNPDGKKIDIKVFTLLE